MPDPPPLTHLVTWFPPTPNFTLGTYENTNQRIATSVGEDEFPIPTFGAVLTFGWIIFAWTKTNRNKQLCFCLVSHFLLDNTCELQKVTKVQGVLAAVWIVYAPWMSSCVPRSICNETHQILEYSACSECRWSINLKRLYCPTNSPVYLQIPVCLFAGFLFAAANAAYQRRGFGAICYPIARQSGVWPNFLAWCGLWGFLCGEALSLWNQQPARE